MTPSCADGTTELNPLIFVIEGFRSGGAQRVASRLLAVWAREGRPVRVITFRDRDSDFFRLPAQLERIVLGEEEISRGPLMGARAVLRRVLRLRRAFRAAGVETAVSFITATNVVVILASLGLGLRVVVSERNDPQRQDPGRPWRVLRRLVYRFADVVTANSSHAVEVMADYVPRGRLAMLPNPVEMPASAARPDEASLLLSVGRLVPQKGQGAILAAFARLAGNHPDWRLAILGEGPERAGLERWVAQCGLDARATLPGTVADPECWYRTAGIFVLASAYEGTPNTLLEAMAHGLPCVVADCLPGALEYVEDGVSGLVFRAGDVDDLCRCLHMLISDPELRTRLGAEGRERVAAFSIEHVVQRWDDVLFPIERGCGGG